MRHFATATAIAALLVSAPALAQQQNTQSQQQQAQSGQQQDQQQAQINQQDRQFAETAAAANMLEVRLGEIAQEKAQNQEVKDFGQRMVEDHQQANDKLMQISEDLQIEVPQDLPQDKQQVVTRFEDMEEGQFDQAYIRTMVDEHQKAVDAFNKEVEQGQNQQLTGYAEETVSTLEEHHQQAQQIAQQMGAMAQGGGQQGQDQQQATAGQDQTEVTVDQAPADVAVDPASPDVTVVDPEPQVRVETPEPEVSVTQPEPEVEVDQAQPNVDIQQEGQPDVTIVERDVQQGQQDQQQAQTDQQQAQTDQQQTQQQAQTGQQDSEQQTEMEQAGQETEQTGQQMATETDQAMQQNQQQAQARFPNLQDMVGEAVYGQTGEQVGEISQVLMDQQGQVERLVIDRGGFLGIGEETIAIDMSDVNVTQDRIQVNMTDEQIAEMPEYQAE